MARLNKPSNKTETKLTALNKEHLNSIIDTLHIPYNTFFDILSIIHLLSDAYPLKVNQAKVEAYLNYAIDKLETMVYEDVHFGVYPKTFNPLNAALTLIQASEKTGNKDYTDIAFHFLNMYEAGFRSYLENDFDGLSSGTLKWSLLYKYLGVKLKINKYIQLSEHWLKTALIEDTKSLAGFRVENQHNLPAMGILGGYAGIGLTLLTLIDKCPMEWLNLIPVYLEKEKNFMIPGNY